VSEHRLAVVGTTGSGKTRLARRLAQQLDVAHIELDALHWEPEHQPLQVVRLKSPRATER
jgi:adenylate kinase family enzyme